MLLKRTMGFVAAILTIMVIGSGSWLYADPLGKHHPKIDCTSLAGMTIPSVAIGLQTGGAKITSATLVPAAPQKVDASGNIVLAVPEYCKVLGAISPVDPNAFDINFEINLPTDWNYRSMQFGGGGFNGTVVTGLANPYPQPPNVPVPLAQGYATFGSDSGHAGNNASFALASNEALLNYAYESLKKTKDTAFYVINRYYGKLPKYSYFVGNSNGAREGHTVVQRFPNDYDGVIAVVPILSHEVAHIHDNAMLTALAPTPTGGGGFMNTAKIKLISDSTAALCDANDGLVDGIISKYGVLDPVLGWHAACQHDVSSLRCPGGVEIPGDDTCLSDAQIAAVHVIRDRFTLPFPLAKGNNWYVGYGAMGGEINDWPSWIVGSQPPPVLQPPGVWDQVAYGVGRIPYYGHTDVRFFIAQNENFQTYNFDSSLYQPRINYVTSIMESTNPDISAFMKKGGKLIMKENTCDYARSTFLGINYYKSVLDKFGAKVVDQSIRLYAAVGASHLGQYAPSQADLISLLEDWVEKGHAPPTNIVGEAVDSKTFNVTASRPMCGYGLYPKYNGSGDPKVASSFTCVPLMGP